MTSAKYKIMQVQQSANEHITRILGYSKYDAYLPRDQAFFQSCKSFDEIIIAIKDKIELQVSLKRLDLKSKKYSKTIGEFTK